MVGRSAKSVREYLEKNFSAEAVETEKGAVKLCICALLEVVQSGGKNLEVVLMRRGEPMKVEAAAAAVLGLGGICWQWWWWRRCFCLVWGDLLVNGGGE